MIFLFPFDVFTIYMPRVESDNAVLIPLRVYASCHSLLTSSATALTLPDALARIIGVRNASKSLPHTEALPPVPYPCG